jgi:putative transposase
VATGVNAAGCREILGMDVVTSEDGAGWLAFWRPGGTGAVRGEVGDLRCPPRAGRCDLLDASRCQWQRCRTHFLRNLLAKVPKSAGPFVATLVRSIFAQPDREAVWAQFRRVVEQLSERFPVAAEMLEVAGADILAFAAFPFAHWKQIWSNNPQERLNKEIRRRTDVVGIFPNRDAVIRLVGMVLCEQHDEWQVVRRYMSTESLAKARLEVIEGQAAEEVKGELVAAS